MAFVCTGTLWKLQVLQVLRVLWLLQGTSRVPAC